MTHHTRTWSGKRENVHYKPNPRGWLEWTATNDFGLESKDPVQIWGQQPPGWVRLRGGDSGESMTVCGHKIEVITGCWTCGRESTQMWACTCAGRRT
jgi:hypothetical protein